MEWVCTNFKEKVVTSNNDYSGIIHRTKFQSLSLWTEGFG